MRKALAALLVGVSVFLLVTAGLLRFYAPGKAKKTPLDLDITLVATGPAKFGVGGGQTADGQLQATRIVRVDSAASDSKNVVVVETLCIVKLVDNPPGCVSTSDPKNRLVSFTTDRVAADRKTAESVNDPKYGEYVNSDSSVKHVGLSYKWPFDAKKKSYKFFDPQSGQAPDARYVRTEKLEGINCYVYEATENNLDVDVAPGVPGKYDDTRTVWIDPVTGTILKGVEYTKRSLDNGDLALETTLTFDQKSIKYQAKKAKDGRNQISLLTVWLPLVGGIVGLVMLAGGIYLASSTGRGRSSDDAGDDSDGDPNDDLFGGADQSDTSATHPAGHRT